MNDSHRYYNNLLGCGFLIIKDVYSSKEVCGVS